MEIIGIRFSKAGKIYYFDPDGQVVDTGKHVIVETSRGVEYGTVVISNRDVPDNEIVAPLKKITRVATAEDDEKEAENKKREAEALEICHEKIKKHELPMKLINVEMEFNLRKITFYFTADGRVDFRELVKELASVFRMRIELRQVGVRDEAKILNGMGICGRHLCCANFLSDFQPVSIKMAKEQNLSLSPIKISGICGRLMCCLKYEQETYEIMTRGLPQEGDLVMTPDGKGTVLSVSVLKQLVKVAVKKRETDVPNISFYNAKEVRIISVKTDKTEENIPIEELKGILD